jgi:HEAT repeat protein
MCLLILDESAPRPKIRDALISIARDHDHYLNDWATSSLRRYVDNAQVKDLLKSVYAEDRLDPYHQALVALGLGRLEKAGELLLGLLTHGGGDVARITIVKRLGEIGANTHIPGLKSVLEERVKNLESYVVSRLALGDVAPETTRNCHDPV